MELSATVKVITVTVKNGTRSNQVSRAHDYESHGPAVTTMSGTRSPEY